MIENYTLNKVKSIFNDGITESIEFHFCGQTEYEYVALIKDNKVTEFYKKNCTGGSDKVYKVPAFIAAALEYFNKNDFDIIEDYRKN